MSRKLVSSLLSDGPHLVCLVWEVDLVKYLSGLVLNGLHLHVMGRILPLTHPHRPLQPLQAVQGDGMSPGVQEVGELLHEVLAAVEEPRGEPEEFPASLITSSDGIVCQLLHDLAVDLVPQYLLNNARF